MTVVFLLNDNEQNEKLCGGLSTGQLAFFDFGIRKKGKKNSLSFYFLFFGIIEGG